MEEQKDISRSISEKLSDSKTVDALNHLLDRLTELHESGVMDSFIQTVQAVTFMKDGLTDTMVSKNATALADLVEIASEAASPEVLATVKELKNVHRAGKLKDLFEITDTISFMFNSATEKMMERNAAMMGGLMDVANESADPSIVEAVRSLKELQKSGNLKALTETSYMLTFLTNSMTESIVQRTATFMATFVEEVATPHVQDLLRSMTKCMLKTVQQFTIEPPKPGIRNLISTMKDHEVQMGLIFMAALAKNMHQCMTESYSGI
ncbi:MAG: DUF1641 domain-containing protein [Thermodesulfovibrionales bacterium]|nr:DUF1641 domain-containing protein [Thermodesulfovibrionales bacterium]